MGKSETNSGLEALWSYVRSLPPLKGDSMDDVLKMARAVGFNTEHAATNEYLRRFAEMIRANEREACAKVCENAHDRFKELWEKFDYPSDEGRKDAASQCAAAIRSRGQK